MSKNSRKLNIVVIGAGVIGVTSAIRLQNEFGDIANVVLISATLSPDTTGDGSAGLWGPFLCGQTPAEDIVRWSNETHTLCRDLWKLGEAEAAGICLVPVYRLTTEPDGYPTPEWSHVVYGCHQLSAKQLEQLSKEHGLTYSGGHHFVSFTLEPTMFLPYLMKKFYRNGGVLFQKKVNNFQELSMFDLIINCTGIGAKELANDDGVNSIRGQVSRVVAPWVFNVFLDDSDVGNYIIPNMHSVVLGGTHQEGDFNINVDNKDSLFITDGCSKLIPSLKEAKKVKEWVGLRPGRNKVRLELEIINDKAVVHNYGHGGSGVTLSWGCAADVVKIVSKYIKNGSEFISKL